MKKIHRRLLEDYVFHNRERIHFIQNLTLTVNFFSGLCLDYPRIISPWYTGGIVTYLTVVDIMSSA